MKSETNRAHVAKTTLTCNLLRISAENAALIGQLSGSTRQRHDNDTVTTRKRHVNGMRLLRAVSMLIFFLTLGVGKMTASTTATLYYAVDASIVACNTVTCYYNFGYSQTGDVNFTKTDYTYNGWPIYTVTLTADHDNVDALYFKPKGGSDGEQLVMNGWTALANNSGKMYVHNSGWQTYSKDASYTVYFVKPDGWKSAIKAYAYSSDCDKNAEWPGQAMSVVSGKTFDGKPIYSIEFAKRYSTIIFTDKTTGSNQTSDLTLGSDNINKMWTGASWYENQYVDHVIKSGSTVVWDLGDETPASDPWTNIYMYRMHYIAGAEHDTYTKLDNNQSYKDYNTDTYCSAFLFRNRDDGTWPSYRQSTDITGLSCDIDGITMFSYIKTVDGTKLNWQRTPNVKKSTSGVKVYFDNSDTKWSNIYLKYGTNWTPNAESSGFTRVTSAATKVTGTQNLYSITLPDAYYKEYFLANAQGSTGWNSIEDMSSITGRTAFQLSNIAADSTIIPSTGSGSSPKVWSVSKIAGHTRTVTITAPTHGTITVTYTDESGTSQTKTSGSFNVAQTCILTVSATGATGYYDPETITINAGTINNGDEYTVRENISISASFSPKPYTITLDNQSAKTAGTESITVTYDASTNLTGTPAITKPTRSGYTFGGYYTAIGGGGTQIIDADGNVNASAGGGSTYTDASKNWKYAGDITLYAKWTGITYNIKYRECDNSTEITGLLPTTYTCGVGVAELPTPTKSGYTFDAWYSKYCVYDDTSAPGGHGFGWVNGCRKTDIGTTTYGDYVFLAKWHQTVTLDMQGVCSALTPTVDYLGTELTGYSTGSVTLRDGTLLGYYTAAGGGTKVLNADGSFAASAVTDYITDGKWTKAGATTLYAHWAAAIELPDTLRKSNYVAYGGGLTFDSDYFNFGTGASSHVDGYAEWQADIEKCVYNVTIVGNYPDGHNWGIYLVDGSGTTVSTCSYGDYWSTGDRTETKQWDLSGISTAGIYTIKVMNTMAHGSPKLLYVAMDPITVTYDANGGTCATASAYYAGSALTLPTATKDGYVFEGWYSSGTKIGNAGGSYVPTASITLTAKWGQIVNLPNTLTKTNVGDYSSDMTWYGDEDEYFDFGPTDAWNLDRWAKWEVDVVPCTYNVTIAGYYPNSHQWQLVLTNGTTVHDTLKVSSSDTGEWDLTGIAEGTYTLEVKNIYKWSQPKIKSLVLSPNIYTITYNAGEYGTGTIVAGQKIGCHDFTLSSSTFTRAGYEQDGWATSDGGSKVYNLGGTYSTDAAITLYPHWTCATPPVPTNFTAGSITDASVTFTITDAADAASYEIYYSTSSTAPVAGTAATTTSTDKSKEVTGLTAGTTYFAWVRAVCDGSHKSDWVALNPAGATHTFKTDYSITMGTVTTRKPGDAATGGTISSDLSHAVADAVITLTATPKSSYTFIAWKIEKSSDNSDVTNTLIGADSTSTTPSFTMPAYSVTVKATFARQYTISYKEDDKTTPIEGVEPTTFIYGVGVPALPTPVRAGYTFVAWYKSSCVDGGSGFTDGCKRTAIDNDSYGDYTFYGKFTPNTHDITYTAPANGSYTIQVGGAAAVSESTTGDYAQTITLAATPANVCYTFNGWTVTGATPADASAATTTFTMPDNDVTVAASFAQVNLALGKTPIAGYTPGDANEVPSKMTDGNTGTAWTTYNNQEASVEWFYVDLGAVYQLNQIELVWGEVYSTDYILQVRHAAPANSSEAADDSKWYTIAEVTDAAASATKSTAVNVSARYVRFHSLTKSGTFLRLYEFRVFGTGTTSSDNTAPVINTAAFNSLSGDKKTVKIDVTVTEAVTAAANIYWTVVDKNSAVHEATYSAGVLSVTNMPTGKNQSVTIYAMDEAANISAGKVVTIGDYVNPDENLALNKTRYACINYNVDEGMAKANDGSESTYMTTYTYGTKTNEWWYVDLGEFFDISKIEVVWMSGYHSTSYSIQYRQNAPANNSGATSGEWDEITNFKNKSGNQSITISDVQARYICLRSAARYEGGQLRLAEVRVYGTDYGTPDDDAPSWTDANCAISSAEESTITMTLEATDDNPTNIYAFVIHVDNGSTSKDYERTTTALSNAITITDAEFIEACHTYTVTAKCYDHVGNEATKVFSDVVPSLSSETNIFSGASATVDAGTASVAIDGNTGTRWTTGDSNKDVSHWILVDIGEVRNVSTLKIAWETACPKDYYIEGSVDGTNYYPLMHETDVPSPTGGSFSGYTEYAFEDAVGVRYMKVRSVENNTGWGMSIFELQAYGACYEESNKPITTFARVASQEVNGEDDGMNVTFEVGAYDYATTYANMRYKIAYTPEGGATTVLDNQTATSGQLTINDLAFSTNYTVVITARDAEDGNLADNSIELNFSTQDNKPTLYFRNSMNWQDGGLSQDYRFSYVSQGSDVVYFTVTPNTNDLQYRLFDDTDNDGEIDNPGDTWSTAGNQHLHNCNGQSVTFYATDQDHFVSTADLVYVVGSSVKTNEANALQMIQSGTTYYWEGPVTAGNKFKIIVKAQESDNIATSAFTNHSRVRIMADSATFTNSSSWGYAKLTFDMATWEYEWTAADTFIFDNNAGSGDGKWSTASNWLNNAVPAIDNDVILQAPVEVDITDAQAKSIVIDQYSGSTGQLIIAAGKELVVAGTVQKKNAGGTLVATEVNDIFIGSSSAGNGALVIGSHDGTNKARVLLYTKTNGVKDQNTSVAQYLGTPFNNETNILHNWYNSWIYGITYNGSNSIDWVRINEGEGMTPFRGYCVYSADGAGHIYDMEGTLNATSNVTCSGLNWQSGVGSANVNNENLLANSWTAPIRINAFVAGDFVKTDATVYIFNATSNSAYVDVAGNYTAYTPGTAGENDVIPSMQSFSVFTNASGGSSVTLDYERLVYNPAVAGTAPITPNYAPNRKMSAEATDKMHLYVSGTSGYSDMLYLLENEDFLTGFENGWDGRKLFGEGAAPQLYALTPDGMMTINCVPTWEGAVLGFRKGTEDNAYAFTFDYEGEGTWYLNDLKEEASTLISSENTYTFTTAANDSELRFVISATPLLNTPTGVNNAAVGNEVYKIIHNDHVYIIRQGRIFDVTGVMVR